MAVSTVAFATDASDEADDVGLFLAELMDVGHDEFSLTGSAWSGPLVVTTALVAQGTRSEAGASGGG